MLRALQCFIVLTLGWGSASATAPTCSDFNDATLQGWSGPGVTLTVAQPGPTGVATDYYMRGADQSGTSYIQAPARYLGDWRNLADSCATLSWDVRWFVDGNSSGSNALTPSIVIQNGSLRAAFQANFTVSEDGGPNPGWHSVRGKIAHLGSGNSMPSNSYGAWIMLDGAPNSDWETLLANVTLVYLGVENSSLQIEVVGYDNVCIEAGGGCTVAVQVSSWTTIRGLYR